MIAQPSGGLGVQGGGSVAVELLFNVLSILFVGVLCLPLFCYALLCVHSRYANILKRKRKLVALLVLSNICNVHSLLIFVNT